MRLFRKGESKRGEASLKIISPSPLRERGTMGVRVIEMGKKSSGFEARNQGFLKVNGLEVCKGGEPAS